MRAFATHTGKHILEEANRSQSTFTGRFTAFDEISQRMNSACCWLRKFPHAYALVHFQWFVECFFCTSFAAQYHSHVRLMPLHYYRHRTANTLLTTKVSLIFVIIIRDAEKRTGENVCVNITCAKRIQV